MTVDWLKSEDEKGWDDFVDKCDEASFFHKIEWKKLVEKVYGSGKRLKPLYLVAKSNGTIEGILPLFLFNSKLFGKRLISIPFANSGGSCANSDSVHEKLITRSKALCDELNADYLELRNYNQRCGDLLTSRKYFTLALDLEQELDVIRKNFRKDIKKRIKKGKKNGISVKINSKDFETFYKIFSRGQWNFGTPIHSYDWLKNLFFNFSDQHTIALAYYQEKPICVKFIRKYKDTVATIFSYILREYRNLCPHHILTWELIKEAHEQGYKKFDFGRSLTESGSFAFKKGWRAQPIQLHYQYYLNKAKNVPDLSQANSNRKLFAKVWKRLPLSVANTCGPMIRQFYP